MKQSLKRLISVVLALVMAVSAFIVFFQFTQPEYLEVQAIRGEEAARREFVDKQQSAISQVQKLIKDYKDDTDFQVLVSTSFPLEPDFYGVVSQVSGLVKSDGLTMQSISITESQSQDARVLASQASAGNQGLIKPINTVTFRMQLFGGYEDIKKFIQHLETNIRIFDVVSFDIRPLSQNNASFFNLNLEVATYYQSQ